jgi:glycyl-tRNA synthetase beta chain
VREKSRAQFEATAATFRRIGNILAQAHEKNLAPMGFHASLIPIDSVAERELADAVSRSQSRVQTALSDAEDYLSAYAVLAELRPAVDLFFEKVMVMDPDARLRDNRLALLRALHELFAPLADFSKLQVEKSA